MITRLERLVIFLKICQVKNKTKKLKRIRYSIQILNPSSLKKGKWREKDMSRRRRQAKAT